MMTFLQLVAEKKTSLGRASLFTFGPSYFVKALKTNFGNGHHDKWKQEMQI